MKSVLRSIKPYWLYLILTGKKTIEVGKNFPKNEEWDKIVYLYCTKDRKSLNKIPAYDKEWMKKYLKKVACKFICTGFMKPMYNLRPMEEKSCVPYLDLIEYSKGKQLYGWHISDLVIYDKPKELGEFKPYNRKCYYSDLGLAIPKCKDCHDCYVERPPQSWCYIEELGV